MGNRIFPRRVIFLDFGGVLHSTLAVGQGTSGQAISVGFFGWLPELSRLLKADHELGIVVHSAWQHTHDEEELKELLGAIGDRVVGVTPGGPRYPSIEQWLKLHPSVQSHRILDDEPLEFPDPAPAELIVCDPTAGVADPCVIKVLEEWLQESLPRAATFETRALLATCRTLCMRFPESLVITGDVAKYIRAVNCNRQTANDSKNLKGEIYLALCDLADLRDTEIVVPDRRGRKHTMTYLGFKFDVFSERHTALNIPQSEVFNESEVLDSIRVASATHLAVLRSAPKARELSGHDVHTASDDRHSTKQIHDKAAQGTLPTAEPEVTRYVFFTNQPLSPGNISAAVSLVEELGAKVVATSIRKLLVEAEPSIAKQIVDRLPGWKCTLDRKVISFRR